MLAPPNRGIQLGSALASRSGELPHDASSEYSGNVDESLDHEQLTELVASARTAIETAVVFGAGKTRCGAAVLTMSGRIYSSGNLFSETHTLTLHAEQGAIAHAAAHGDTGVVAIAIACDDVPPGEAGFARPCGICRQLIYEVSSRQGGQEIQVIMCDGKGEYDIRSITELLPFPWISAQRKAAEQAGRNPISRPR